MEHHTDTMRIAELKDEDWGRFRSSITGHELDYYWFIVDWLCCREKTRIWTYDQDGHFIGAMLTFGDRICQLRGDRHAAVRMFANVPDTVTEMVMPKDWAGLLPNRSRVKRGEDILLMKLARGGEHLTFVKEPERLNPWDLDDIVTLLHEADGVTWGGVTAAALNDSVATGAWYGIREGGRIVALAGSWMKGDPKHVNMVAVLTPFRGHGYARSVLSRLLEDIFHESSMALINVRADNVPAIRAYKAVGFIPDLHYYRVVLE